MRESSKAKAKGAKAPRQDRRPSSRKAGSVLSLLGAFVAASVALGLLISGTLLPLAGFAGFGAKKSVKVFNEIPDEFTENALSQQSRILAADGSLIAAPSDVSRIVVPSADIPQMMKNAQVAIEDERFYQHGALDRRGITRAIASNLFSSGTQGASTLTQQYVKVADENQKLAAGDKKAAQEAVSQTGMTAYVRKIKQLKYAVDLEKTHTKDQILTSYLNLVYFGQQQYGIQAAAMHYFGHPAKDLTLPEAATLAGVVNLPGTTDPINNPEAAVKRRNIVLQKMAQQHMITPEQEQQAINTPLKTNVKNVSLGCASSKYPYYCDYVMDYLSTLPAFGKTPKERLAKIKTGGYTIQTALDPKKMAEMDKELKKRVPVNNSADVQAASTLVEPGTGYVVAMAQNTKYDVAGSNTFNTAVNYARSGFPIGSTAKLMAIVEAMRQGHPMDSTIDVPKMNSSRGGAPVYKFTSKDFPGKCGLAPGNNWQVGNDHQVPSGPMSYSKATAESVNTAFARLVGELGACKVRDTFGLLGVQNISAANGSMGPVPADPSAIVLGTGSSSTIMMANAFATIAADGKYCPPSPVKAVKRPDGKSVNFGRGECKQVISKDEARATAQIFTHVFDNDGTAYDAKLADGRQAFGKTGTTDGSLYTWFAGATPQFSTAVWVGRGGSGQGPIGNVTIGGKKIGSFLYGGDLAAPAWQQMMNDFSKGIKKENLPQPSDAIKTGKDITVPSLNGRKKDDAKNLLENLKLKVKVVEQEGQGKPGEVFKTDPGANGKTQAGKEVTIYVGK